MERARLTAKDLDAESAAWLRRLGAAAHLAACGPCGEDFTGLLAAITGG